MNGVVVVSRMSVRMSVRVGMAMLMTLPMVVSWTMLVLMNMFMFVLSPVLMLTRIIVPMGVICLFMHRMSRNTNRVFPRQSQSAFFTHYSISNEARSEEHTSELQSHSFI